MKLSEVMQRDVQVVRADATVREAARRMSTTNVGVLAVLDDDRIAGMVTDRDLVVRAVARGEDPDEARVSDAMTPEVDFCFDDETIDDASRRMSEHQTDRLLVLDRRGELVGIVSIGDLARAHVATPQASADRHVDR